jgi:hypothetical protein
MPDSGDVTPRGLHPIRVVTSERRSDILLGLWFNSVFYLRPQHGILMSDMVAVHGDQFRSHVISI